MRGCPACDEQVLDLIYGELPEEERARLEEHLRLSPLCAREADGLRAAERASRRSGDEEPSPALLAGLKAEARKQAAELRAERSSGRLAPRPARPEQAPREGAGLFAWLTRRVAMPVWVPAMSLLLAAGLSAWLVQHRTRIEPLSEPSVAQVRSPADADWRDAPEPPPPPAAVAALPREESRMQAKTEALRREAPRSAVEERAKAAAPPPAARPPAPAQAGVEMTGKQVDEAAADGTMAGIRGDDRESPIAAEAEPQGEGLAGGDLGAVAGAPQSVPFREDVVTDAVTARIRAGDAAGAVAALDRLRGSAPAPQATLAGRRAASAMTAARPDLSPALAAVESTPDFTAAQVREAALAVARELAAEPELAPRALAAASRLARSLGREAEARALANRLERTRAAAPGGR